MPVIDIDKFITYLVYSGVIDKATCGELKEAIELCTVKDIYTKADMVAMIEEKVHSYHSRYCPACEAVDRKSVSNLIQEKINALKENK